MDQRTHDVEEDLKNILHTRLALSDKIDRLERHVEETVEATKTAALDALDLARNKAAGFIESTTHHLSPSVQAGRRPWTMVGAAIALGLFAGVIEQRRRATRVYPYYPPQADAADVMPEDGRSREPSGVYPFYGREHARAEAGGRRLAGRADYPESTAAGAAMWKPVREVWQELSTEFAQERDRLQQAALLAGRSFLQDLVRIAGQSLIDQLSRPAGSGTSGRANPSRLRVTAANTP